MEIVLDAATLVVLYGVSQLDPAIVFKGDITTASDGHQRLIGLLDGILWYILLGIALVVMYELYKHGKTLYQMKRGA